jgi:hypothetical protein
VINAKIEDGTKSRSSDNVQHDDQHDAWIGGDAVITQATAAISGTKREQTRSPNFGVLISEATPILINHHSK